MLATYALICVAAFVGSAYLTDRILAGIERERSSGI